MDGNVQAMFDLGQCIKIHLICTGFYENGHNAKGVNMTLYKNRQSKFWKQMDKVAMYTTLFDDLAKSELLVKRFKNMNNCAYTTDG